MFATSFSKEPIGAQSRALASNPRLTSSESDAFPARPQTKATRTSPRSLHVTVTAGRGKMAPTRGEDVNCELTVTDECIGAT
jgi:hypothetical protein